MADRTARIDGRYSGAPGYGNGGYSAGLLASFVEVDAEVRINSSFAVATSLTIGDDGCGGMEAWLGGRMLGSARAVACDLRYRCHRISIPRVAPAPVTTHRPVMRRSRVRARHPGSSRDHPPGPN